VRSKQGLCLRNILLIFEYEKDFLLFVRKNPRDSSITRYYIIGPYQLRELKEKKIPSEGRVIESLAQKLNLDFRDETMTVLATTNDNQP
jgi:hypothetical protein